MQISRQINFGKSLINIYLPQDGSNEASYRELQRLTDEKGPLKDTFKAIKEAGLNVEISYDSNDEDAVISVNKDREPLQKVFSDWDDGGQNPVETALKIVDKSISLAVTVLKCRINKGIKILRGQ